jgi:PEP-CTERM motif
MANERRHSNAMNLNERWLIRPLRVVALLAVGLAAAQSARSGLVIDGTFTAGFTTSFGANAANAQSAWNQAVSILEAEYSDPIHINITVNAVAGTGVFGQSNTFLDSTSYANMRSLVVADAKSADDSTAVGAGGSVRVTDPTSGGTWWLSKAQAKALGLIPDDLTTDGTVTFGAGNPFFFNHLNPVAGEYDLVGIMLHEISEVMGRLGISGGAIGNFPNSYSLIDDFSYTGPGAKGLGNGGGNDFSIDNGTTLLKLYNNAASNGLDSRDWAPGTNDAFNQFSDSGVTNGFSATDARLLDVLGYDLVQQQSVPEPGSLALVGIGLAGALWSRRRKA